MPHPDAFFIKPAPGLRIADPVTGEYLPEGGMLMPRSGFWLRRLKDGDVIAATTNEAVQSAKPTPAKAGKDNKE